MKACRSIPPPIVVAQMPKLLAYYVSSSWGQIFLRQIFLRAKFLVANFPGAKFPDAHWSFRVNDLVYFRTVEFLYMTKLDVGRFIYFRSQKCNALAMHGLAGRAVGKSGRKFRLFDFKNTHKKKLSSQQKRIKSISISLYTKRYLWHLILGVVLTLLGCGMCIVSLFSVQLMTHEKVVCMQYQNLVKYRAQLTENNWHILTILFYLRYPGPIFAGMGIFEFLMTTLFILWLIDRDVSRAGYSSNKMDIYDMQAATWKAQTQGAVQEIDNLPRSGGAGGARLSPSFVIASLRGDSSSKVSKLCRTSSGGSVGPQGQWHRRIAKGASQSFKLGSKQDPLIRLAFSSERLEKLPAQSTNSLPTDPGDQNWPIHNGLLISSAASSRVSQNNHNLSAIPDQENAHIISSSTMVQKRYDERRPQPFLLSPTGWLTRHSESLRERGCREGRHSTSSTTYNSAASSYQSLATPYQTPQHNISSLKARKNVSLAYNRTSRGVETPEFITAASSLQSFHTPDRGSPDETESPLLLTSTTSLSKEQRRATCSSVGSQSNHLSCRQSLENNSIEKGRTGIGFLFTDMYKRILGIASDNELSDYETPSEDDT